MVVGWGDMVVCGDVRMEMEDSIGWGMENGGMKDELDFIRDGFVSSILISGF